MSVNGESLEEEVETTKKSNGLHLYPEPVYTAALNRLCRTLKASHPDFQNRKRVSQSRAFEFIMDQVLGESDAALQEHIELRNKQRELKHEQTEQMKTLKRRPGVKTEREDDDDE